MLAMSAISHPVSSAGAANPPVNRPNTSATSNALSRRRLSDRRVDARQHLFGHQLHRALGERRIDPVHTGIDDLAEVADLLAQRQKLLDHLVDAAVDHAVVE